MKNIYYVDDSGVMRIERRKDTPLTVNSRATFLHPLPLFVLSLLVVFLAGALTIIVLPSLGIDPAAPWPAALLDGLLLSALMAPFLYVFVYRPLRSYLTEWAAAQQAQKLAERRFQDVAENAVEWLWEVDPQGKFTYVSPVVRRVLGYEPGQMLEMNFFERVHPEDREEFKIEVFRLFARKKAFQGLIHRNQHRDGHAVWVSTSGTPILDEEGELLGYRGMESDITEIKVMEQQLKEAVLSDELTGLLNRRGFDSFAEFQFKVAQRNGWGMAVLFVDVDDLASINSEFGHAEGDQALRDLAMLFRRVFRKSDIIARLGGDEFAILMMIATEQDAGKMVAQSLGDKLQGFNEQGTRKYLLAVTTGFATCAPGTECSIDSVLAEAKRALYQRAKESIAAPPGPSGAPLPRR